MGFILAATTYVINYAYRCRDFLNFMTDDSWTNENDNTETVVVVGVKEQVSARHVNMLSIKDALDPSLLLRLGRACLPEEIEVVTGLVEPQVR
jgi:hypothetical protein